MTLQLVAILGDACSMASEDSIPDLFKQLFEKRCIQHMIVTGNMGVGNGLAYLHTVCDDIHMVNGFTDPSTDAIFQKTLSIAGYTILLLNGAAAMVNISDTLLLSSARINHADICVYGDTFDTSVQAKDGILFINPGSISGAFHPYHPCMVPCELHCRENNPSFVLLSLNEKEVELFVYQIRDGKLDVGRCSFHCQKCCVSFNKPE